MIEEKEIQAEEAIKSEYSLLELGKNLVRTSHKKIEEKNLIIIGEKCSGKSALFNTFLQTSNKDTYIPTCGINYSYMRYQPNSTKKSLLNIYEIGGGINNVNLIRTIITDKNISNTFFVLSLDFSKPNSILKSFKDYLRELTGIMKDLFDQDTLLDLIESKKLRYKDINSNDFKRINIFPGELIVIGNKYDCLEKIEVEKIKWVCRSLRFFCHVNATSLIYFKSGDSKLIKILNSLITSLAFSGGFDSMTGFIQKNDILPLFVLYSLDSILEIGDPKVFQQGNRDLISLWEDTFFSNFPNDVVSNGYTNINSSLNKDNSEIIKFEEALKETYKEPRIDEELQIFERRNENPLLNNNINQKNVKKGKAKRPVK